MRNDHVMHDVSIATISKIVLFFIGLALLYVVRDILLVFFVALILAALITPLAERLAAKRIPRSVTVLGVYVILVALFGIILSVLLPPVLDEVRSIVTNFSGMWENLMSNAGPFSTYTQARGFEASIRSSLDSMTSQIPSALLISFSSLTSVFDGLFSIIVIFVLGFYLVVEAEGLKRMLRRLAPESYQPLIVGVLTRVQKKLGDWLRAQLILSGAVALLTYIGLLIVGLPYALVLALLAGLLELVPYAGPVISSVPALILALSISPFKAAIVLAVYIVVQQSEGHFLIPKINQKIIGINPIVSIMALLLGARLGGVLGILISIPLAASITMLVEEWVEHRKQFRESV